MTNDQLSSNNLLNASLKWVFSVLKALDLNEDSPGRHRLAASSEIGLRF
jgi:hypothetical protein